MTTEQFLNCPFCGSPSKQASGGEIVCTATDCPAYMPAELWQRRTPGPATAAMLEWVRRQIEFVDHSDCPTVSVDPCFEAFLDEQGYPLTVPDPSTAEA